jgi:hypothetical protein
VGPRGQCQVGGSGTLAHVARAGSRRAVIATTAGWLSARLVAPGRQRRGRAFVVHRGAAGARPRRRACSSARSGVSAAPIPTAGSASRSGRRRGRRHPRAVSTRARCSGYEGCASAA